MPSMQEANRTSLGISELTWLVVGNMLYFSLAIILAFALQDNRAFCKYLCPITVFLKATSRLSLLKIDGSKLDWSNGGGDT